MSSQKCEDFPFDIPEVDLRILARSRHAGRLPDFDIYEPYVQYKIYPLIRENIVNIIEKCRYASPEDKADLEKMLINLGRSCAMVASLHFAAAIDRSKICEASDIVYADTYMMSFFMLMSDLSTNLDTKVRLNNNWKSSFRRDTNYLILSHEATIQHVQNSGWRLYQDSSLVSESRLSKEDLINMMVSVCQNRIKGKKRVYSNLSMDSRSHNKAYKALKEELSADDFKYCNLWIKSVEEARRLLEDRKVNFWPNT